MSLMKLISDHHEKDVIEASKTGDWRAVASLVNQDARCITERAHKWPHRTPLMIAAREGHTTLVHYLLGRGAFVDSQDEEGWTALMYASAMGHAEAVDILLDEGNADVALREEGSGMTALMWAAYRGHTRIVASLLRHRGSGCLDAKSLNGLTALCWASLVGNTEAARLLVEEGHADARLSDAWGRTAMATALEHGHKDVAKMLLKQSRAEQQEEESEREEEKEEEEEDRVRTSKG